MCNRKFVKPQHIQEKKDFCNPGLPLELYNFINEIWKSYITEQRANFRRALIKLSQFLVEKQSILYRNWEELEISFLDIKEINNLIDRFQYFINKGTII